MPDIRSSERSANPYPLVQGGSSRRTIAWQFRSQRRGGDTFLLLRRGTLGARAVVERFPLTPAGWEGAWRALVREDRDAAREALAKLRERERPELDVRHGPSPEIADADSQSLVVWRQATLLGGYAPEAQIAVGETYDVRFLEDRLAIFPVYSPEPRAEVAYHDIEDVEIGGPGLVKTGGGFSGGGFGAVGALEGMAIAGVLNALTTRTSITTVARVQAVNCELFLLHTKLTPDQLRMQMSPALGAIRAARAAPTQDVNETPASIVRELSELADMLRDGLITREEFDQLKGQLLQLGVLGRRRRTEQDQPAADPDEDQIEPPEGHGRS